MSFPCGSDHRESACYPLWETLVPQSLEEGMAAHSTVLAWRTPRTGEPGGLQSMGSQESDTAEPLTQSFVRFVTCLFAVFIGTFDEQMFLVSKLFELI